MATASIVVTAELLHEPLRSGLRPHEDEREPVAVRQELDQRLHLVVGRDRDELVVDLAAQASLGQLAFEAGRHVRVAPCHLADLAVERRGEEHRLAVVSGRRRTILST